MHIYHKKVNYIINYSVLYGLMDDVYDYILLKFFIIHQTLHNYREESEN